VAEPSGSPPGLTKMRHFAKLNVCLYCYMAWKRVISVFQPVIR